MGEMGRAFNERDLAARDHPPCRELTGRTFGAAFTDIFIRRPVVASVISLMILVVGLRSFISLPVLQFPHTENAMVMVTTTFYGADPTSSPDSSRRRWRTPSPRRTASTT